MKVTRSLVALLLGMVVFCTLGVPFKKMNFYWDSYGNVLFASQCGSGIDFIKNVFYKDIRFEENHMADNEKVVDGNKPPSLFSFIYRPMAYVYFRMQYDVFGQRPYLFFLFLIFVHALNVMLLFWLLAEWVSIKSAVLGGLLFAYNHTWWSLLRWFDIQPYFIEAFFLLLFALCLTCYFKTRHYIWPLLAGLCLLHNLFLKEQSIAVLPWVAMVFFLHHWLVKKKGISNVAWVTEYAYFSMPSWIAFGVLIGVRWCILRRLQIAGATYLYHSDGISGLYKQVMQGVKDIPNMLVDLVGLNWFPPFHKPAKAFFLLLFILFFGWLLRAIKQRGWFLFFTGSFWLFAWPIYTLRGYHPRFIYFPMVFVVGLIALAFYKMQSSAFSGVGECGRKHYRFAFAGLLLIVVLNASFLIKRMQASEQETDFVADSFQTLVAENPGIFERTMCFYGLPPELFDACVAQAMTWLAPGRQRRTIYYFKHQKILQECSLDQVFIETNPLFITWDERKQKMIIRD